MAVGNAKLFQEKKRGGAPEDVSLFQRKRALLWFDWQNVDTSLLLQTLGVCNMESIGVGFYPASGGRGVCFKLYRGRKNPDIIYVNSAEELNEALDGLLERLDYKSEDGARAEAAD